MKCFRIYGFDSRISYQALMVKDTATFFILYSCLWWWDSLSHTYLMVSLLITEVTYTIMTMTFLWCLYSVIVCYFTECLLFRLNFVYRLATWGKFEYASLTCWLAAGDGSVLHDTQNQHQYYACIIAVRHFLLMMVPYSWTKKAKDEY